MKPIIVPAIFKAKDEMTKNIARMQSKTKMFARQFSSEFDRAGKNAFKFGRRMAVMGALIAAPLVVAAKSAVDFEAQMGNVATLVDTSVESIDKMGDNVLSLAKKLPVPINELTASLYDIRSAGIASEDAMATLEFSAKLSAAGLSTTEEATNILTSAMNAFRSEGLSAATIADTLFKTVKAGKTNMSELAQAFGSTAPIIQSAGIKLADFQAATAALTTLGTPASQAQTQLNQAIAKLMGPTAEMTKVFKQLGVTTHTELIQKYGTLGNAFGAVNDEIVRQGLSAKKTWGSVQALSGVTALLGETNGTYLATLEDMRNGTNALDEAFEKQKGTAKSQMQIMKNNVQSLSISLGKLLIPMINELIETVVPYIQAAADWVGNNKELTKTIVKVAAGIAAVTLAVSGLSFVYGAVQKAMVVAKFAMLAFNAVAMMNPIGAIIAGALAGAAAVYALSKAFDTSTRSERLNAEVKSRAMDIASDQLADVKIMFAELRRLKVGTDEYNNTLSELEKIQPGITAQYNLQKGAVEDLNRAEQELTKSIMARAMEEARAELIKEKIKAGIERSQEETGFMDWVKSVGATAITGQGVRAEDVKKLEARKLFQDASTLTEQQAAAQTKKANPEAAKAQQQNLNINISGLPEGSSAEMSGKKVNTNTSGGMPQLATNL